MGKSYLGRVNDCLHLVLATMCTNLAAVDDLLLLCRDLWRLLRRGHVGGHLSAYLRIRVLREGRRALLLIVAYTHGGYLDLGASTTCYNDN